MSSSSTTGPSPARDGSDGGPIEGFRAVVPAGGAGTRLWPLSRAGAPKFLHDLTGTGRTLLQATVDRLLPLTGPQGTVVVTGRAHEAAVREQLPELGPGAVLAEPSPRDSMAAIGLAAAVLVQREGDVVIGSFAADHVIDAGPGFAAAVREGVSAARAGYVVTVGIAASGPSTAFGYVRMGGPLGVAGAQGARHSLGFTEKPDAATAAGYLATGEYRWNAGMFIVRAQVLLDHLARLHPDLHAGLREIAAAWDTPDRAAVSDRLWPELQKIAIDHAIAEPVAAEGGVAVVAGDFSWDDIGDFDSLAGLLPADGAAADGAAAEDDAAEDDAANGAAANGAAANGDAALGHPSPGASSGRVLGRRSDVLTVSSPGSLVVAGSGRLVTVLGLPDVVVVDTPDAILVTTRAHAQELKLVVDAVRESGRTDLL